MIEHIDPDMFTQTVNDMTEDYENDQDTLRSEMFDWMAETLNSLGYGEGVKLIDDRIGVL